MTTELSLLFCPECGRDCLAEAPPCSEGHGDRCPDRACVECGAALLLDVPLFSFARRVRRPAA